MVEVEAKEEKRVEEGSTEEALAQAKVVAITKGITVEAAVRQLLEEKLFNLISLTNLWRS